VEPQVGVRSFGAMPLTGISPVSRRSEPAKYRRFEVDSFKDDSPDIYDQFQIRDWEPLTMPLDPYSLSWYGNFKPLIGHDRTS
ncbi:hypothetical protein HAX54_035053, partial [Datura stramonium]|nr:hypothetical protein [Datura stramonium]